MTALLITQFLVYALSLWVGLYLLANDVGRRRLLHASAGLLSISLAVAVNALWPQAASIRVAAALVVIAASFWTGGVAAFLPDESLARRRLLRFWQFALLPLALLVALFAALSVYQAIAQWLVATVVIMPLIIMPAVAMRGRDKPLPGRLRWLLALVSAMFIFSLFALYLLQDTQLASWALAAAAFDLSLLGLIASGIDARVQGERFLRDFVREVGGAFVAALLFGLPVLLTMAFSTGAIPPMIGLSLVVIGLAIASQTLNDGVQSLLDRMAFPSENDLRHERATLRETAAALPRAEGGDALALDDAEFVRVTRRALSQISNLPKLAASPLAQLALVDQRLDAQGLDDNTLTRAAELKTVLVAAIDALRPGEANGFDASEAWRFYNALYYPYVVGIKPYRRRPAPMNLDADAQAALDWMQLEVPERTLYNWQKTGAELVATHLRDLSAEIS